MGLIVKAGIQNYHPLVLMLEEEAADVDSTAKGLHKQLTSFKFLALLHLTGDIPTVTNHLHRIFQYQEISFSALQSQVRKSSFSSIEIHNNSVYHTT